MAKIAVTPSIVLAEFILYRKRVSMAKASAFVFMPMNVDLKTNTIYRNVYNSTVPSTAAGFITNL